MKRAFRCLTVLLLAVALAVPTFASALYTENGENYTNPGLGISFDRPADTLLIDRYTPEDDVAFTDFGYDYQEEMEYFSDNIVLEIIGYDYTILLFAKPTDEADYNSLSDDDLASLADELGAEYELDPFFGGFDTQNGQMYVNAYSSYDADGATTISVYTTAKDGVLLTFAVTTSDGDQLYDRDQILLHIILDSAAYPDDWSTMTLPGDSDSASFPSDLDPSFGVDAGFFGGTLFSVLLLVALFAIDLILAVAYRFAVVKGPVSVPKLPIISLIAGVVFSLLGLVATQFNVAYAGSLGVLCFVVDLIILAVGGKMKATPQAQKSQSSDQSGRNG